VKLTELAASRSAHIHRPRLRRANRHALNRTIEDGLQKVADEVVFHCPTGALWKPDPAAGA